MFKDKIRWIDIKAIVKFGMAFPVACILKPLHKKLCIVSERPDEARDNGFVLFEYIRKVDPDAEVFYVIKKDGVDREKITALGNVLDFYSFKHYVYYWMAKCHISAHVDAGTPNSRISNFLETHGFLNNKKVFLQHGVIKDLLPFCFYRVTRADIFCCQARDEFEYVKANFGYPQGNVRKLGCARFDKLLSPCKVKRQILVMPTWRSWLAEKEFDNREKARKNFIKSKYYVCYNELLSNEKMIVFLEKENLQLVFYVHSDMQNYSNLFVPHSERIVIASAEKYDVQQLLIESKVLITDYSSVFFDFAFMKKPVCYYHFDYKEYRQRQHPEGYYDYSNGFGPVFSCADDIIVYLKSLAIKGYVMDDIHSRFTDNFFDLRDGRNCERIYNAINSII